MREAACRCGSLKVHCEGDPLRVSVCLAWNVSGALAARTVFRRGSARNSSPFTVPTSDGDELVRVEGPQHISSAPPAARPLFMRTRAFKMLWRYQSARSLIRVFLSRSDPFLSIGDINGWRWSGRGSSITSTMRRKLDVRHFKRSTMPSEKNVEYAITNGSQVTQARSPSKPLGLHTP